MHANEWVYAGRSPNRYVANKDFAVVHSHIGSSQTQIVDLLGKQARVS